MLALRLKRVKRSELLNTLGALLHLHKNITLGTRGFFERDFCLVLYLPSGCQKVFLTQRSCNCKRRSRDRDSGDLEIMAGDHGWRSWRSLARISIAASLRKKPLAPWVQKHGHLNIK